MTTLTERYLEVALRGFPDRQRPDVEGELRSSIADAVEDRVAAGEDRAAAERAVLEGLGNPAHLAAAYTGRPMYLIGPDLYPVFTHVLPRLLGVVVPVVALVLFVLDLVAGRSYASAIGAGIVGALMVGVQVAFWTTLTFVFLERAEAARDARSEIARATGRWTVDMLPEPSADRISAGDTVGEVITTLISIGGLLFLANLSTVTDDAGRAIPVFDPALTTFWFPVLIGILAVLAALQVLVFVVGRWTLPLAIVHGALQVVFAVPIVVLALNGTLVNPAFADAIGWPPLAERDGPVMLSVAAVTTIVGAWEIVAAFRHARRSSRAVAITAPSAH